MFTMLTENTRRMAGTVTAVAVVAFTGLTLEQGHHGALPRGTVEVGELTAVNLMQMARVTLPGIVVTGQRAPAGGPMAAPRAAQHAVLPGLAAAAAEWALSDDSPSKKADRASSPTVLLK